MDLTDRALLGFVVDARVVGGSMALSLSDTQPIAYGRRLLDDSKAQSVIAAGYDIDTLHLLGGIVLVAANVAMRFLFKSIVGVENC